MEQVKCDVLAACCKIPLNNTTSDTILSGVMGSKLTRQRSLDFETKVSKRRRQRNDSPGESERSGDFLFTSLMLKSDKLPGMLRRTNHCPYVRRVAWVREIQRLLREQKMEQAGEVLKLLRKVKGLHYFGLISKENVLFKMLLRRLFEAASVFDEVCVVNTWAKRYIAY